MSNLSNTASHSAKRQKKGFNFIDFLLIVIALCIIAGMVYLFSPVSFLRRLASKTEGMLDYTVEIQNVDIAFVEKIKENDIVVNSVTKSNIGTVTAVDHNTKYSVLDYQLDDNNTEEEQYKGVMIEYPERYNIRVTISVSAEYVEGQGYDVNGVRIAVGEKLSLRFSDYVCEGYCIYVTPTEDFK